MTDHFIRNPPTILGGSWFVVKQPQFFVTWIHQMLETFL